MLWETFTPTEVTIEAALGWVIANSRLARFEVRVEEPLIRVAIDASGHSIEGYGGTFGAAYCDALARLAETLGISSPVAKP